MKIRAGDLPIDSVPAESLIRFCQSLVRIPSVNGEHPERPVAEEIARFAASNGLAADIVGSEPARPNVLVRVGPSNATGLLLVAHTDTVPFGDEQAWTHAPLSGAVSDGKLYGRGAIDNKGGIASALGALLVLNALPEGVLRKGVAFVGVPDEEAGATGTLGIRFLHDRGLVAGRGAVYVYPGMDRIELGHRGVWRLTLTAHGTAFHSGSLDWQEAGLGNNAVTGLAEIALELERLRFPRSGSGLFAPFRTVITPTKFSGGSGPSIVPPTASAYIDVRLVPDVPQSEVENAILEVVARVVRRRPPLSVDMRTEVTIPHTEIPTDSAIVSSVQRSARQVLGAPPVLSVSGPANESYILNRYGVPTCVFGPAGANGHSANEYLVVDTLASVARIYALVALDLADDS
jgi:acetylornithine deacetylase/succinyl-diaminopimelate desuccinylase-like protein